MKYISLCIFILFYAALNAQDGVLDLSFGTDGYIHTDTEIPGSETCDAVLLPDNSFIIAGNSEINDTGYIALYKFLENGEIDTSFGDQGLAYHTFCDTVQWETAFALGLQSDGKIIVGGYSKTGIDWLDYNTYRILIRFNAGGEIDSSFGENGIFRFQDDWWYSYNYIMDIAVQPDDKILVSDTKDAYEINPEFAITRINSNGGIDSSFGVNGSAFNAFAGKLNYSHTLAIQPDGKIIVSGKSDIYFGLARYNQNGNVDSLFGTNGKVLTDVGGDAYITDLAIQEDNKILAMGISRDHTDYSYENFAVARYNEDGSPDLSFSEDGKITQTVFNQINESAHGLFIQPDHKILIGAKWWNAMTEGAWYYFVRFKSDGVLDSTFSDDGELVIDPNGYDNNLNKMLYQGDGKLVVSGFYKDYYPNYNSEITAIRVLLEMDSLQTEIEDPEHAANLLEIIYHENLLQIISTTPAVYQYAIYNSMGQVIQSQNDLSCNTSLNLNNFPKGIYFLIAEMNGQRIIRKIMIG